MIAVLSFILAEIGLFANKYLPMWQAIIVLLLLVLVATYFFGTRLKSSLGKVGMGKRNALVEQGDCVDSSENNSKNRDKLEEEEQNKDFGDFHLGQDAIDRLLLKKVQPKSNNEVEHLPELTSNIATEESQEAQEQELAKDAHTLSPIDSLVPLKEGNDEEQSGVIEDSYNNAELFSDFDDIPKAEKAVASQDDEQQNENGQLEIDVYNPSMGENSQQEQLEKREQSKASQEDNEILQQDIIDVPTEDGVQNELHKLEEELTLNQYSKVDLEDLLSGQRNDNDSEGVEEPTADSTIHVDSSDEDDMELLQRRASLFAELDGEGEAIIEDADILAQLDTNETTDLEGTEEIETIEAIESDNEDNKDDYTIEIIEDTDPLIMEQLIAAISETISNDQEEFGENEEQEHVEQTTLQQEGIEETIEEIMYNYDNTATGLDGEEDSTISNVENLANTQGSTKTQQQILHTMVQFIELSKAQLSVEEYEELIRAHMAAELSDHDYFIFSYLLIEHYILQGQYDKLTALLQELKARFSKYPVLNQQIQYLFERYC